MAFLQMDPIWAHCHHFVPSRYLHSMSLVEHMEVKMGKKYIARGSDLAGGMFGDVSWRQKRTSKSFFRAKAQR